jgi:protein-S-isoprenylcysteine O-methyltransferase Ste14
VTRSRLRVAAGYLAFVIVVAVARPTPFSLSCALPFALLGEAIRVWASGHIEKTRTLATGGPYAHTRNPLYVGSLLLALAAGAAAGSPWGIAVLGAYLLAFYPFVVREEAAFLRARFPVEYAEWEKAVPLFLPRLRPAGPRGSRFSWARVRGNREWRTALALPVVLALLWARGRYGP